MYGLRVRIDDVPLEKLDTHVAFVFDVPPSEHNAVVGLGELFAKLVAVIKRYFRPARVLHLGLSPRSDWGIVACSPTIVQ